MSRGERVDTRRATPLASTASEQRLIMRTFPACSFGGLGAAFAGASVALAPAVARADEPRNTSEPHVMMESGEVTNVIDAFDDHDLFDVNIGLGFEFSSKSANVLRETSINAPGLTTGGFTTNLLNVAKFSETTSKLIPRIDIGLYKDLAIHLALPIVLSNARELTSLNGSDKNPVAFQGAPGEQLFSVSQPFTSPTRSGIEHIAAGLDFNILNQARDLTKPTWLFGFEGRFSVGTPMHACNTKPASGQLQCANPADINRNGRADDPAFEGADASPRTPGVSRGIIGLDVHTMMSKRIKYIEPYGGFNALIEFQQAFSDYGLSEFEETLVNHPPIVGSMILGMMVIPWENREKWNRLTFDLRFTGTYHSEGREYSELFDALGSSDAASLRNPQWQRYKANPDFSSSDCTDPSSTKPCLARSVIDDSQQSTRTYTTGLSDVQAYGSFRASASVTWQAGEYVKFQFGGGFRHDQGHGITGDQPCNPAVKELARSGPCRSGDETAGEVRATGLPNPNYRPTINAIGRRFFVDDSNTFDLFASGVVMF